MDFKKYLDKAEKSNRKKIFVSDDDEKIQINPKERKKNSYKVISISLYNEEIEFIDRCMEVLSKRGIKNISRSKVIRYALEQLDLERLQN